jgi:PKD repeat protein
LRVTLNGTTEDVVVIIMHAKCCSDSDSWQRRQNASNALKSYLDTNYPTQKVWVIGDFNDDVDTSITPGSPSPYSNFVNDSVRYRFPTKALSDAGVASTTGFPDMIDHHLNTNEINATYVANSVEVYRVDQYITNYANTTSDHYPVLSRYTFGGGTPTNNPPTASFTFTTSDLTANFNAGGSSDSDGSISSYSWNFGDGTTGSGVTTSHTYAAAGTYTVTLTVTDNGGASNSTPQSVTVSAPASGGITLSASGYKVKGLQKADLFWSGAASISMDIFRNGIKITTTANDGAYTDNINLKGSGSYTYKVCEAGTTKCSNQSTVIF